MYLLLFFSALSSATLLPGSSEVLLTALLSQHPNSWFSLWLVATLGNTLGGYITFAMGWWGVDLGQRYCAWLPKLQQRQRAIPWLEKYGCLSLCMSWLPVFGDALCLLAGMAKLPPWRSVLAMFIGKAIRYAVLLQVGLLLS